jgi:predicted negative regulator of RcsB-dependent stress response
MREGPDPGGARGVDLLTLKTRKCTFYACLAAFRRQRVPLPIQIRVSMPKRRPAPKRKASSRQTSTPDDGEDVFIGRMMELTIWARKNTQALILGGVALALIIVAGIYYVNFRTTTSTQATEELSQIQQLAAAGEIEGAKSELTRFLDRFGGTRQAVEARLLLGELHLQRGQADEAIAALEPAARSLRRNPVALQAAMLLGAAYEDGGRPQEAEETYLRVADRAELAFQVQDALDSAARIRADRGDYAGAGELYRQILATLEADDPMRGVIQLRLAEVTARRNR